MIERIKKMAKEMRNGINLNTLISGIALVGVIFSIALSWYVSITRPKLVPKPHLVITASTADTSPWRNTILVQNTGDAVAHDFILYAKFPEGAKITFIDKGVFDLVEGGSGENFAKLKKDQIGPAISLPYIVLAAEKKGMFVEPTLYAESQEILKIPINLMRVPSKG